MNRVKKILVATDYSDNARRAEIRAAMLSLELKAEPLELMTIQNTRMGLRTPATFSSNVEIREDAAILLLERNKDVPAILRQSMGPTRVRTIRTGNPADAIVARADEIDAGLTVVAARGKSFFASLFARDNNDELIRLSERPVLLVNCEPKSAYQKVLVASDFSAASREAARMALTIAPSAHFTFLHVFGVAHEETMLETGTPVEEINDFRMRAREMARGKLNSLIDGLGPRKQFISRSIQHGCPRAVICAQAKQLNADLIAVGKRGKSRLEELLLGSVTQRLLDQEACDVLVADSLEIDEWDQPPAA